MKSRKSKAAVILGAVLAAPLFTASPAHATSASSPLACVRSGATAASATVTLSWGSDSANRPVRVEFTFDGPAYDVKATVRTSRSVPTDASSFVFNAKANNAPTGVTVQAWNSAGMPVWDGSATCS